MAFSNREDKTLLINFLKHLKQSGNITPEWLMSDDAEQFYSAWIDTFDGNPRNFLCNWHVDRSWCRSIATMIKGEEDQISIYHILGVLMEETEQQKFHILLEKALYSMKTGEVLDRFSDYFETIIAEDMNNGHFVTGKMLESTQMYAESFHRVLEHVYMKGNINKRLDSVIHLIMKYARDKALDRIMKAEKGKSTRRTNIINKKHQESLKLLTSNVCMKDDDSWKVKYSSTDIAYLVRKETDICQYNCFIKCQLCSICIHNYSCSCDDYIQRGTIVNIFTYLYVASVRSI